VVAHTGLLADPLSSLGQRQGSLPRGKAWTDRSRRLLEATGRTYRQRNIDGCGCRSAVPGYQSNGPAMDPKKLQRRDHELSKQRRHKIFSSEMALQTREEQANHVRASNTSAREDREEASVRKECASGWEEPEDNGNHPWSISGTFSAR
jgi:hypothetical protein